MAKRKHVPLPAQRGAARPYRLYNAQLKKFLLWYWYTQRISAMRGAYWIAKWLPVGTTLEVIDVRTMRLHAQYTRRLSHVEFHHEQDQADIHIKLQKGAPE